jgi:archaellum biogenesis ATPase FlaH
MMLKHFLRTPDGSDAIETKYNTLRDICESGKVVLFVASAELVEEDTTVATSCQRGLESVQ